MTDDQFLGSKTWTSLNKVTSRLALLVPVGSTEQHGPHLPLDTDTRIAQAIAFGVARAVPDRVVVSPPVAFGASGEHGDFPGTLSIGTPVLTDVLVELGRSADAFAQVVFVNGHGGNALALKTAENVLQREGRGAHSWSWNVPGADAHAGRTETSLLLAIAPEVVDLASAQAGRREPIEELMGELRDRGVRAVSPNGVLGDPTGASAHEGEELLASLVQSLLSFLSLGSEI